MRMLKQLLIIVFLATSSMLVFASSSPAQTSDLIRAIRDGENKKAENLIKRDKDINAQDGYGWTPLMYAVIKGDAGLVEKLLAQDADVNLADRDGVTPLIAAIIYAPPPFMLQYTPEKIKLTEIALALISKGANPNSADNDGNTPLMYAVFGNQEQIIGALISKGADPNRPDRDGRTPVYLVNNPDAAAKWAPADGALNQRYRLRGPGTQVDESHFSPEYAAAVGTVRAQANMDLAQMKARIAELLRNAGGVAPVSPNAPAVGEHLMDAPPRQLGLMGRMDPISEILMNCTRATRANCNVTMLARVASDGTVHEALVISGPPNGISEQLKKAALKLRYQPAMKGGKPVEVWYPVVAFAGPR